MRRGLLLLVHVGLLSTLAGCARGVCDCLVYPISHGTPSPIVRPAKAAAQPDGCVKPVSATTSEPTQPTSNEPPPAQGE